MKIMVNGQEMELSDNITVRSLLEKLNIPPERVVVERNNSEIISRSDFNRIILQPSDRLEILHFIGGG